jgi:hypothetical protein
VFEKEIGKIALAVYDVTQGAVPHCLIANDYSINAGFLLVLFLNN